MSTKSFLFTLTFTNLLAACVEPTSANLPKDGNSGGEEASSGESSDDEDASESSDGEPSCDLEAHTCLDVPSGWNGPVALTNDECGGAFEWNAIETYEALEVDPIRCGCECGLPADGQCATETLVDIYPPYSVDGVPHNGGVCDTLEEQVTAVWGEALAFPTNWNWNDTYAIVYPVDVAVPGSCLATPTVDIPPFALDGALRACEPTERIGACDDGGSCVPQPAGAFEDRVCVWAMGEHACPSGTDFAYREIRKVGVNDTRACSECSCAPALEETCSSAEVTLQRSGAGGTAILDADGQCNFADVGSYTWSSIALDPGTPSGGACQPIGGRALGGIQSQDDVTFCCT